MLNRHFTWVLKLFLISLENTSYLEKKSLFLCYFLWPVVLFTSSCLFHLGGKKLLEVLSLASAFNTLLPPTKAVPWGHGKSN